MGGRQPPLLALFATLAGCPAPDPGPAVEPDACAAAPTWDTFAEGYVRTWCTPCHSAAVPPDERQGAPVGVDFDRWSQVYALRERVAARATGEAPEMPPLGGVDPAQTALLEEWLACGAPGSDPPPGPCDQRVDAGVVAVGSQAEADTLCERGNTARDLEVSAEVIVPCLCEVLGELTVRGGALSAPLMEAVGGDLLLDGGSLVAPSLRSVGAAFAARGPVQTLSVPGLGSVGGRVDLADLGLLAEVSLEGLVAVGGGLTVARSPAVVRVDLPRLRTVAEGVTFEALPALEALDGTRSLRSVGGDLVLRDLPRLRVLDDWAFLLLEAVGGSVRVTGNDALLAIHGFTVLPAVPGDLVVEDNAAMVRIDGFDNLRDVNGALQIRANPRQQGVLGFVNLTTVGGALALESLPVLRSVVGFEDLAQVGHLRVVGAGLPAVDGFGSLSAVEGDLELSGNGALAGIDGFAAISAVGGDLTVANNPALATGVVEDWIAGVEVGGEIRVTGNATP